VARGGARPGAGRKKGGHNRLTEEAIAKAQNGLSPLDYLLDVMRDEREDVTRRIDAAKAAAPYCHAKLQPVDGQGDNTQKVAVTGALVWQPPQP
jgi:hypothetical protein